MKKIITSAMFCLMAMISFAQSDSVYIVKSLDDMSDKVYFFPSRQIACISDDRKTGFGVSIFLDKKGDGCSASDLKVKMVNIGGCVENNQIIILFDDGEKISLVSWNDFNCKGDAWFTLSGSDKEKLSTTKIKKIKVQNGRTYESFTQEVKDSDKDYFIQLFYAINNNKIKSEK